MLRLRFAGVVVFNAFVGALAAAACGSDGGSDIPPATTDGVDASSEAAVEAALDAANPSFARSLSILL